MPPLDESVADAGDVLWIDFGQPVGREQAGRRPALVLTSRDYNRKSSVILVCPITRTNRAWPFQVPLPELSPVRGFVLADQVRVVDRTIRHLKNVGKVPRATMSEVRGKLAALLGIPTS